MAILYIFLSVIGVGILTAIAISTIHAIRHPYKYYIKRHNSLYRLYSGNGINEEELKLYVAYPNKYPNHYDFTHQTFYFEELDKAKEALEWYIKGEIKYKNYTITPVVNRNGTTLFRFKKEDFKYVYYTVFDTPEECKTHIDILIKQINDEKERIKNENPIVYTHE